MIRSILLAAAALLAAHAHAVLTLELQAHNETCGNANGSVVAQVSGGVPPYFYDWSTGETTPEITGLVAGVYTVTVTDGNSDQLTDEVTITNVPNLDVNPIFWFGGVIQVSNAGDHACPGMCNGGFGWTEQFTPNAVPPFTYDPAPYDEIPGQWARFTGYCSGEFPVLMITDATGCMGTFPISAIPEVNTPPWNISDVVAACGNNGSVSVTCIGCYCDLHLLDALGEEVAFAYSWTGGTHTFSNLGPGNYTVRRSFAMGFEGCIGELPATVPDLSPDCGTVAGTLFLDHDQDCAQDGNDEGIPYRVLTIEPGPHYAITSSGGGYERGLLYGSYTIAQPMGQIEQLCPASDPVPFTISSGLPAATVNFADSSTVPLDVYVGLSSTAARPGFVVTYHFGATNSSGQLSGALDGIFNFDPSLSFISASPAPTSTTGSSVSWSGLPNLGAFDVQHFSVQLQVPASAVIGSVLNADFSASQPFTETILANNTTMLETTVTGSYDPNDKTARTSSGTSDSDYLIGLDQHIDYTIRFQNTGTDTAFTVVVTDTLAAELDMGSFEQGLASHPFDVEFRSGRVVSWTFANILLPDSNVNEAGSHGLVSFRIRPVEPLMLGTVISNNADIFFDFNPPVRTNDAVLTAQISTGLADIGDASVRVAADGDRMILFANGAALHIKRARVLSMDGRLVGSAGALVIDPAGTVLSIDDLRAGCYMLWLTGADGTDRAFRFAIL